MSTHHPAPAVGKRGEVTGRMVFACLVGFFVFVGAVNAIMIGAALSTFGGVETENAYQVGLAFAREMAALEAQDARHWNVRAKVSVVDGATELEVLATDGAGRPLTGIEATGRLLHPIDRRADHSVAFDEVVPGRFQGRTDPVVGQWSVVIDLSRDGVRMFRSKNRVSLH
jgi:nitrogen fixation protein FixH